MSMLDVFAALGAGLTLVMLWNVLHDAWKRRSRRPLATVDIAAMARMARSVAEGNDLPPAGRPPADAVYVSPASWTDTRPYFLSEAEKAFVFAHFQALCVQQGCAACGYSAFNVERQAAKIVVAPLPDLTFTPCVVVVCEQCGLIRHHSAQILGLIPRE